MIELASVSTEEKLAEMQAQIVDLKDELRRERQKKAAYDDGLNTGIQAAALQQGLVDGGIPSDIAWQMMLSGIQGTLKGV